MTTVESSQEAVIVSGERRPRASHAFPQLDGWRGISILLVLACHLLPLGPKRFELNVTAGNAGMAIFFSLSGFLITTTLIRRPEPLQFFVRRFARIVPLAYLYIVVALSITGATLAVWCSHLFFYANLQLTLTSLTAHLWSLCVEMQFYIVIGCMVRISGRKALSLIPCLLLAMSCSRVYFGGYGSIETYQRVDEILTGACLALAVSGMAGKRLPSLISAVPLYLSGPLLVLASHPFSGAYVNAARGYLAAIMVGQTLLAPTGPTSRLLNSRILKYFADTSYALYVIHPLVFHGWMSSGGKVIMYFVKRPLGFAILFPLATLSTFYFERRWTDWARRIS